ncbi:MAG: putative transposase [Gammaproteobacteria bacterium]|jgi:putative transposase
MSVVIAQRTAAVPIPRACAALGVNRSSVYARQARALTTAGARTSTKHTTQPRALTPAQREHVHATLNNDEFAHQPPRQIYLSLLERGVHLSSVSTMHRILREHGESGERRDQRVAQRHAIPRLEACAPNEVWTWDCSKFPTRARGRYLTLYVVLDLFSRFVYPLGYAEFSSF